MIMRVRQESYLKIIKLSKLIFVTLNSSNYKSKQALFALLINKSTLPFLYLIIQKNISSTLKSRPKILKTMYFPNLYKNKPTFPMKFLKILPKLEKASNYN